MACRNDTAFLSIVVIDHENTTFNSASVLSPLLCRRYNRSGCDNLAMRGVVRLCKIQVIVQTLARPRVAGDHHGGSELHLIFVRALAASELSVDGEAPRHGLRVEVAAHSAQHGVGVAVGGDWGDTAGVTVCVHHLVDSVEGIVLFYLFVIQIRNG